MTYRTVVERYVLTQFINEGKDEEIIAAFHRKKEAEQRKKELKSKEKKSRFYINHVVFDGSKIKELDEIRFKDFVYFAGHFYPVLKHYFFDAANFDFSFEVGMAVDYVNGFTKNVKIKHQGLEEWF